MNAISKLNDENNFDVHRQSELARWRGDFLVASTKQLSPSAAGVSPEPLEPWQMLGTRCSAGATTQQTRNTESFAGI